MAVKKERNLRKRRIDDDAEPEEGEGPTGEELRRILEDTKLLQRQRDRRAGLDAASLLGGSDEKEVVEVKAAHGVQDELMGAFSKEETRDDLEKDPEMEKYIESQLAKRLGIQPKKEGQEGNGAMSAEDDLYSIPDNLRGQQVKQQDVSSWMTGIQEVELPLNFKLKNIEETEAAKKALLASAGAGPGREQLQEEEDEDAALQRPKGVHRAVFPRDFGRQNGKDVERRVQSVLSSQVEKPSWRERKGKGRGRRPGG